MSNPINNFTQLKVWQASKDLAVCLYKATQAFPRSEMFGLTSQMRRAAISISSNIAEGFGRQSKKEKIQFYSVAIGSITELQSQLIISEALGFLEPRDLGPLLESCESVKKMASALIKSIRAK